MGIVWNSALKKAGNRNDKTFPSLYTCHHIKSKNIFCDIILKRENTFDQSQMGSARGTIF
jgi:hypothetical protein